MPNVREVQLLKVLAKVKESPGVGINFLIASLSLEEPFCSREFVGEIISAVLRVGKIKAFHDGNNTYLFSPEDFIKREAEQERAKEKQEKRAKVRERRERKASAISSAKWDSKRKEQQEKAEKALADKRAKDLARPGFMKNYNHHRR